MGPARCVAGRAQRRLLAAALISIVTSCRASPAGAAEATAEQIDQGRELYTQFCATCHGRDMVNTGGFAFDLRTFPKADLERFKSSVANGKGQGMPAWRDQLSDEDIALLWAYVESGGHN
jgi:mono/diheme cytochrome c family protein